MQIPSTLLAEQFPDRLLHLVLVQGEDLLAGQVDTAAHPPNPFSRDEGLVVGVGGHVQPVRIGVAQVGLDTPLEPKGIFLPCGHQQSDPPSFPGEQPVQHRSARVHSRDNLREGLLQGHPVPVAQGVPEGVHEGVALVLRRGLRLPDHELPDASMRNVSVIVPPASIASTRGLRRMCPLFSDEGPEECRVSAAWHGE